MYLCYGMTHVGNDSVWLAHTRTWRKLLMARDSRPGARATGTGLSIYPSSATCQLYDLRQVTQLLEFPNVENGDANSK